MGENSYRIRFEFWLDMEKPEQEEIADLIEALKNKRLYSKAIRDGLRLYWDLCQGRVDALVEQFPLIQAKMATDNDSVPNNSEVLNQLERLENLIRKTDTTASINAPIPSIGGLQPIAAPPITPPLFDDDDDDLLLTVTKADTSNSNASQNFLDAMLALQGN